MELGIKIDIYGQSTKIHQMIFNNFQGILSEMISFFFVKGCILWGYPFMKPRKKSLIVKQQGISEKFSRKIMESIELHHINYMRMIDILLISSGEK